VTLRPSAANGESRELSYSNSAFTTGVVQMDGQNVLVQYGIDAMTGRISPEFEGLGIDANGDGRIDFDENSPETDYGNHGEVIFRVGEHYVSTKSIDSSTGVIVLQSRLPSEYHRIELTKGTQIPDFSFIDFGGNTHRFSDYRGKYVLLDFWATWCPPCVAEIPFLKELYDRFRSRNFEIIGMDVETGWDTGSADELKKGVEKGRQFVSQKGINWPQARTDGIAELVNNRFRVNYYPMKLLLDPRGRILLRQGSKGHDDLVEMLSKLLPGK
jgi:thiol-disulfide isomerase/thioredoxin